MGSELFDEAIPLASPIGEAHSSPEVVTNVSRLEKIQRHLITLAFSRCVGQSVILIDRLVVDFCERRRLSEGSFKEGSCIATAELGLSFQLRLIRLSSAVLRYLSGKGAGSGLPMRDSIWN